MTEFEIPLPVTNIAVKYKTSPLIQSLFITVDLYKS